MSDTEILNWLAATGSSLIRQSQPDMGGKDWFVSNPLISSSRRLNGTSPRHAVELAAQRIKDLAQEMSA